MLAKSGFLTASLFGMTKANQKDLIKENSNGNYGCVCEYFGITRGV